MTAAPRWPADAALLREVLTWARVAGFNELVEDHRSIGQVRHIWTQPAADGWMLEIDRVAEGRWFVAVDRGGPNRGTAVFTSVGQGVDILAALGVLPSTFSSAYRRGRVDGMDVIHELSVEKAADERVEELWSQLKDPDTLAGIGRDLDGLLDRDGFVRRAQVDLVVETVLKAAGMGA